MAVPCTGRSPTGVMIPETVLYKFCPPDDEHMCSKHAAAWNRLIVKFSASSRLILINKYIEMYGQQNIKIRKKKKPKFSLRLYCWRCRIHLQQQQVVMLRCCARRRDCALERLRGDVIDLPYKPPQHNETIDVFYIKKDNSSEALDDSDWTSGSQLRLPFARRPIRHKEMCLSNS